MAIFNSEGNVVSKQSLRNAYPNISFRFPVEQSTLDALNITDFTIGELIPSDETAGFDLSTEVRLQRNTLLSESDYTQLRDAPVDSSTWATYRQELRDLPNQAGFPDTVIWPVKPGDE